MDAISQSIKLFSSGNSQNEIKSFYDTIEKEEESDENKEKVLKRFSVYSSLCELKLKIIEPIYILHKDTLKYKYYYKSKKQLPICLKNFHNHFLDRVCPDVNKFPHPEELLMDMYYLNDNKKTYKKILQPRLCYYPPGGLCLISNHGIFKKSKEIKYLKYTLFPECIFTIYYEFENPINYENVDTDEINKYTMKLIYDDFNFEELQTIYSNIRSGKYDKDGDDYLINVLEKFKDIDKEILINNYLNIYYINFKLMNSYISNYHKSCHDEIILYNYIYGDYINPLYTDISFFNNSNNKNFKNMFVQNLNIDENTYFVKQKTIIEKFKQK